jgi:quinol monooxygenase YgiN
MPVFSFVRLQAKPTKEEEFARAAQAVLGPSSAEPGCISIHLFRSLADPSIFFFHSAWKSPEAFQAHADTPHLKAMLARAPELLAGPPDVTLTERLD